jgi:hypothetical protein
MSVIIHKFGWDGRVETDYYRSKQYRPLFKTKEDAANSLKFPIWDIPGVGFAEYKQDADTLLGGLSARVWRANQYQSFPLLF